MFGCPPCHCAWDHVDPNITPIVHEQIAVPTAAPKPTPACPTDWANTRAPHLEGESTSSLGVSRPGLFTLLHPVLVFGAAPCTRWPLGPQHRRGVPAHLLIANGLTMATHPQHFSSSNLIGHTAIRAFLTFEGAERLILLPHPTQLQLIHPTCVHRHQVTRRSRWRGTEIPKARLVTGLWQDGLGDWDSGLAGPGKLQISGYTLHTQSCGHRELGWNHGAVPNQPG